MILHFDDVAPDDLGELLWNSWISTRLIREPDLRAFAPRPEWHSRDDETKALWRAFGARLVSIYGGSTT